MRLLKCKWTMIKRLPRCKMTLKKRLLEFSRRLHARILKTMYMHKMRCELIFFFFLMIRPPPRSTLFPCPTLFRSLEHRNSRFRRARHWRRHHRTDARGRRPLDQRLCDDGAEWRDHLCGQRQPGHLCWLRSEEHTSELQSQSNLVCRLLLERKKLAS